MTDNPGRDLRGSFFDSRWNRVANCSTVFLRWALGSSFLSAVADRFGWWGSYGLPNVAWGDFAHFIAYTGKLNPWAPAACFAMLAWTATIAEIALGFALIMGVGTRIAAVLSGLILLLFAISMTFTLGIKAPLNFSVYSASAGAFLLGAWPSYSLTLDAWRIRRKRIRN